MRAKADIKVSLIYRTEPKPKKMEKEGKTIKVKKIMDMLRSIGKQSVESME